MTTNPLSAPIPENGPACLSCRYLRDAKPKVSGHGRCHRFPPPIIVQMPVGMAWSWPLVPITGWCGEFHWKADPVRDLESLSKETA
jgi:hypothetical protein